MASNIYLKLGEIAGESSVKLDDAEGLIEIMNFSYSCYQPVSESRSGTIHTTGRANHGTVNFSKYSDLSSASICASMWSGETIGEATITSVTNNGGQLLKYMVLTLNNVVISNYSLNGGGNSIPSEEISLSFSKIKIEYNKHDEDGNPEGQNTAEWDLALEQAGAE